jgi:hypothetical protein
MQDRTKVVWQDCQHGTVTRMETAARAAEALRDTKLAAEVD